MEFEYFRRAINNELYIDIAFTLTMIKFDYRNGCMIDMIDIEKFDPELKYFEYRGLLLVCKRSFKKGYNPITNKYIKIPDIREVITSKDEQLINLTLGKFLGYITPIKLFPSFLDHNYKMCNYEFEYLSVSQPIYGESVHKDYLDVAINQSRKFQQLCNKLNAYSIINIRERYNILFAIIEREIKPSQVDIQAIKSIVFTLDDKTLTDHIIDDLDKVEIDDKLDDMLHLISCISDRMSPLKHYTKDKELNNKKYIPKLIKAYDKRNSKLFLSTFLDMYNEANGYELGFIKITIDSYRN